MANDKGYPVVIGTYPTQDEVRSSVNDGPLYTIRAKDIHAFTVINTGPNVLLINQTTPLLPNASIGYGGQTQQSRLDGTYTISAQVQGQPWAATIIKVYEYLEVKYL